MKKFYLKTKNGEVINSIEAFDIDDAIRFFAVVKNISEQNLLEIYVVSI